MPTELKQHLALLRSFLNSDSLGADGRLWVLNEIWDIEIDNVDTNLKGDLF